MSFTNLAAGLRPLIAVTASIAVVALGFLPIDGSAAQELAGRRVVASAVRVSVFTPTQMDIPKIGLRAPIVPVGTEADGKMAAPTTAVDVGWWLGRRPGEGNALFDAHRDYSGRLGSFYRLKELEPGDEVIVRGENESLTYRVIWLKTYERAVDATDLLGNGDGKQMATLITCEGVFDRRAGTSRERLVARAELVSA